jgi:hypothetical protein
MQILKSLRLILLLPLITAAVGCVAVQRNSFAEGSDFQVSLLDDIKPGIKKGSVVEKLGKPYAYGKNLDGNGFWIYRLIATKTSTAGGGLFVVGFVGSTYQEGASATIVFDGNDDVVKQIIFEKSGYETYHISPNKDVH